MHKFILLLFKDTKRFLFYLFILALILRLGFISTLKPELFWPDSKSYSKLAKKILNNEGYYLTYFGGFKLFSVYPPLIPCFMAANYYFFNDNIAITVMKIIQAILGSFTAIIIFKIGKIVFNDFTGKLAGLISALYPFFIFFGGYILSETIFIFLFCSGILFLIKGIKQNKIIYFIFCGLYFGFAQLTRAAMLLFLPLVIIFIIIFFWKEKKIFIKLISIIVFFIIAVSPWIVRNYNVHGVFLIATSVGGKNLYDGNNPWATGELNSLPEFYKNLEKEYQAGGSEIEIDKRLKQKAKNFIIQNPKRFLKLTFKKFCRFWNLVPNFKKYRTFKYILVSLLSYGLVLICGIIGFIISLNIRLNYTILLFLPVFYFCSIHSIIIGSVRYRLPVMPFIIIFAAVFINKIFISKFTKGLS